MQCTPHAHIHMKRNRGPKKEESTAANESPEGEIGKITLPFPLDNRRFLGSGCVPLVTDKDYSS